MSERDPVHQPAQGPWHESLAVVLIVLIGGLIITSPVWGCVLLIVFGK